MNVSETIETHFTRNKKRYEILIQKWINEEKWLEKLCVIGNRCEIKKKIKKKSWYKTFKAYILNRKKWLINIERGL